MRQRKPKELTTLGPKVPANFICFLHILVYLRLFYIMFRCLAGVLYNVQVVVLSAGNGEKYIYSIFPEVEILVHFYNNHGQKISISVSSYIGVLILFSM